MNTTPLEIPPGFVLREEAHKAAYENGFRISLGVQEGWLGYRSTTARGDIWIARAEDQGSWLLSITHAGIAAEFEMPAIAGIASPGFAIYAFASLQQLYQTLERVYKLGVSLPDAPLESFKKATAHLPRTTAAERMTRCSNTGMAAARSPGSPTPPCCAHRTSSPGPNARPMNSAWTCTTACYSAPSGTPPSTVA